MGNPILSVTDGCAIITLMSFPSVTQTNILSLGNRERCAHAACGFSVKTAAKTRARAMDALLHMWIGCILDFAWRCNCRFLPAEAYFSLAIAAELNQVRSKRCADLSNLKRFASYQYASSTRNTATRESVSSQAADGNQRPRNVHVSYSMWVGIPSQYRCLHASLQCTWDLVAFIKLCIV